MDWERKFYDIVRETESNLENARRKLQGSGMVKSSQTNFELDSPSKFDSLSKFGPSKFDGGPRSSGYTSGLQPSATTSFMSSNDHINGIRRQFGLSLPVASPSQQVCMSGTSLQLTPGSSQGEMRELLSKIDSQNMVIQNLERLVRTLNQEKDRYCLQIKDLQSEVGSIGSRLNESKGGNPHLETQVDLMRHEVRSDMQRLTSLVDASKNSSLVSTNLERSFRDMQHSVLGELEELRHVLNSVTKRVGRLEVDVSRQSVSHRTPRDMLNESSLRASYPAHGSSFLSDRSFPQPPTSSNAFHMKDLKSTVSQLHDKLDLLESRVAASRTSPSLPTSPLSREIRKLRTSVFNKPSSKLKLDDLDVDDDGIHSILDDLDLSDSDLDLGSDLDLDDNGVLSDEIDELEDLMSRGKIGKMSSLKSKSSGLGLSAKSYDKNKLLPDLESESDWPSTSAKARDFLAELDDLDLDSAASEPAGLDLDLDVDSLDGSNDDLKLDDL